MHFRLLLRWPRLSAAMTFAEEFPPQAVDDTAAKLWISQHQAWRNTQQAQNYIFININIYIYTHYEKNTSLLDRKMSRQKNNHGMGAPSASSHKLKVASVGVAMTVLNKCVELKSNTASFWLSVQQKEPVWTADGQQITRQRLAGMHILGFLLKTSENILTLVIFLYMEPCDKPTWWESKHFSHI